MNNIDRDYRKLNSMIIANSFALVFEFIGFVIMFVLLDKNVLYLPWYEGWKITNLLPSFIASKYTIFKYYIMSISFFTSLMIAEFIVFITSIVILASYFNNEWCKNTHLIWGLLALLLPGLGVIFIYVFACCGKKQIIFNSAENSNRNQNNLINDSDLRAISGLNICNKLSIVASSLSVFYFIAINVIYNLTILRYYLGSVLQITIMSVMGFINLLVYISLLTSGIKLLKNDYDNWYISKYKKTPAIIAIVMAIVCLAGLGAEIYYQLPTNRKLSYGSTDSIPGILLMLFWFPAIIGEGVLDQFYRTSKREIWRQYGCNVKDIEESNYRAADSLCGGIWVAIFLLSLQVILSFVSICVKEDEKMRGLLAGSLSCACTALIFVISCCSVAVAQKWDNDELNKYRKRYALPGFLISLCSILNIAVPCVVMFHSRSNYDDYRAGAWIYVIFGLVLLVGCALTIIYCRKVKKELFDVYGNKRRRERNNHQNYFQPKQQSFGYNKNHFVNPNQQQYNPYNQQQPVNNYNQPPYGVNNNYNPYNQQPQQNNYNNNPYNYNNGSYNNQNTYNNINNTNSYNNAQNSPYGSQNGWVPPNGYNNNNNH